MQEEKQDEGIIQGVEAKTEQEIMGPEADGSTEREAEEEEGGMTAKEQEEQEKHTVAQTQKKKKTPKSKIKERKLNVAGISKQLEKQTNYLIKLEKVLQPLAKLAKGSVAQSKVLKEVNDLAKQLERQLLQIQKQLRVKRP